MNCKHLYYLYKYFYKMHIHDHKFIHAPSYSFNELKLILLSAGIIILPKYACSLLVNVLHSYCFFSNSKALEAHEVKEVFLVTKYKSLFHK